MIFVKPKTPSFSLFLFINQFQFYWKSMYHSKDACWSHISFCKKNGLIHPFSRAIALLAFTLPSLYITQNLKCWVKNWLLWRRQVASIVECPCPCLYPGMDVYFNPLSWSMISCADSQFDTKLFLHIMGSLLDLLHESNWPWDIDHCGIFHDWNSSHFRKIACSEIGLDFTLASSLLLITFLGIELIQWFF